MFTQHQVTEGQVLIFQILWKQNQKILFKIQLSHDVIIGQESCFIYDYVWGRKI